MVNNFIRNLIFTVNINYKKKLYLLTFIIFFLLKILQRVQLFYLYRKKKLVKILISFTRTNVIEKSKELKKIAYASHLSLVIKMPTTSNAIHENNAINNLSEKACRQRSSIQRSSC